MIVNRTLQTEFITNGKQRYFGPVIGTDSDTVKFFKISDEAKRDAKRKNKILKLLKNGTRH